MGLLRLLHGIARQIGAQDPNTGSDVTQVGDSVNNAIRVNEPVRVAQNVQLAASAARTAALVGSDQINATFRGIIVYVNVTAASGTGGLTMALDAKDPVSGTYRQYIAAAAALTAVTSSGPKVYVIYPGASSIGDTTNTTSAPLPANWRVRVAVGDTSSYTYSVSADLLP